MRAIAWKAQVPAVRALVVGDRMAAGDASRRLVTTAIAREMAAFLWAIGHEVVPSVAG